MNNAKKKGFTLIELLIVIAIIAVLLTILVPALQQAKKQAKNTLCATNMNSWGKAVQMYAAEMRGYFPHDGRDPSGNEEDNSLDFDWVSRTMRENFFPRYLFRLDKKAKEDRNNVLFCPTDRYHREHHKENFQQCVDLGLVGYKVLFGNDKDLLIVDNGPSTYGGADYPQCPNALEWVTRKKLGGMYHGAPILQDNIQSQGRRWTSTSYGGCPLSSHADPRNNDVPEGGFFLFEDGRVNWYHGIDDGVRNFGEIGISGIQRGWNMYFALPDVR